MKTLLHVEFEPRGYDGSFTCSHTKQGKQTEKGKKWDKFLALRYLLPPILLTLTLDPTDDLYFTIISRN